VAPLTSNSFFGSFCDTRLRANGEKQQTFINGGSVFRGGREELAVCHWFFKEINDILSGK